MTQEADGELARALHQELKEPMAKLARECFSVRPDRERSRFG